MSNVFQWLALRKYRLVYRMEIERLGEKPQHR